MNKKNRPLVNVVVVSFVLYIAILVAAGSSDQTIHLISDLDGNQLVEQSIQLTMDSLEGPQDPARINLSDRAEIQLLMRNNGAISENRVLYFDDIRLRGYQSDYPFVYVAALDLSGLPKFSNEVG